jgi:hypothetical protein
MYVCTSMYVSINLSIEAVSSPISKEVNQLHSSQIAVIGVSFLTGRGERTDILCFIKFQSFSIGFAPGEPAGHGKT